VLSVEVDDPGSYGRLVRDRNGEFERIVETKHPEGVAPNVLASREINTNTFVFDATALADALVRITNDNAAGEYYIGDVLSVLREDGQGVVVHKTDDAGINLGVNTRADLALVSAEARRRILERHMLAGVTVIDPQATWIDANVEIEPDAVIEPGCTLRGATRIGRGAVIGPLSTLIDTTIEAGATVVHSYLVDCDVLERCAVGPFSYIRPQTKLREGAKAGAFVEIKNSEVGAGSKVPHLSYIGDSEIGEDVNVGAGSITANYDGFRKHRTVIGDHVRIGVDTAMVAPVHVGDDAYTGAGSVITRDVPPGALGISRPEQENVEGYTEKRAREAKQEGNE
jgi:bifunctional UDP-N-acetylglucosamine pyrophosphorylase/glucosamine-1-phosphate N-acetyltransferase